MFRVWIMPLKRRESIQLLTVTATKLLAKGCPQLNLSRNLIRATILLFTEPDLLLSSSKFSASEVRHGLQHLRRSVLQSVGRSDVE